MLYRIFFIFIFSLLMAFLVTVFIIVPIIWFFYRIQLKRLRKKYKKLNTKLEDKKTNGNKDVSNNNDNPVVIPLYSGVLQRDENKKGLDTM